MNTLLAWFGLAKPAFVQIDKTATDTPLNAAAPLTRASYRDVLLRNVTVVLPDDAVVASYVLVPRDNADPCTQTPTCTPSDTLPALSARLVYADV